MKITNKPKEAHATIPPVDSGFYEVLLDPMSDGVYFVDQELLPLRDSHRNMPVHS